LEHSSTNLNAKWTLGDKRRTPTLLLFRISELLSVPVPEFQPEPTAQPGPGTVVLLASSFLSCPVIPSSWSQHGSNNKRGNRCYQVCQSPAAIGASWSQDIEATHQGSRSVPFYDGGLASFLPKHMSYFEKSTNLRF
jgi:hypothetical protein